jgi:large subunit ribosomal protein L4
MIDLPIYTTQGKSAGEMAIDEAHLGTRVRPKLLKQAIVMYQANRRQGSAAGKGRGMVQGSTRKLFRQKGTGNARMGPVRNPVRRGGGQTFFKKPRDFRQRMPKRMRRLACKNAILAKMLSQDAIILDDLSLDRPKTKELQSILSAIGIGRSCVLALDAPSKVLYQSCSNIPRMDVRPVAELNAYDVLRRKKLVFTKAAFEAFSTRVAREYDE